MSRSINTWLCPGQIIANWKLVEATDLRSKAGSVIYRCINIETGKEEFKSAAYFTQFTKRKSKKTFPGRERKFITVPLDEFIKFGNNIKNIYPDLMRNVDKKGLINLKQVRILFDNVQEKAEPIAIQKAYKKLLNRQKKKSK